MDTINGFISVYAILKKMSSITLQQSISYVNLFIHIRKRNIPFLNMVFNPCCSHIKSIKLILTMDGIEEDIIFNTNNLTLSLRNSLNFISLSLLLSFNMIMIMSLQLLICLIHLLNYPIILINSPSNFIYLAGNKNQPV